MSTDDIETLLQERKAIFRKIYLSKDAREEAELWAQIFSLYPYNTSKEKPQ